MREKCARRRGRGSCVRSRWLPFFPRPGPACRAPAGGTAETVTFQSDLPAPVEDGFFRRARLGILTFTRVVFALMVREIKTRYAKSRLGYANAFVSPLLQKAFMLAGMVALNRQAQYGTSMILFIWTGLAAFHTFSMISSKAMSSLNIPAGINFIPTVTLFDFFLARVILEFLTITLVSIFGFICIYLFETHQALPSNLSPLFGSIALLTMLGMGVGMMNAVIGYFFASWKTLWNAFTVVLMFGSAVMRVLEFMPNQIRDLMLWNPIAHGVEYFRLAFYPTYPSYFLDVDYLANCAVLSFLLGFVLIRVMRRRLVEGA